MANMCMEFANVPKTLLAETYLDAEDAFHLAHVSLRPGRLPRPHDHDFPEMFWVRQGRLRHLCNGEERLLEEGTLAFIRPYDCHAMVADRGGATLINLMFRKSVMDDLGQRYDLLATRRFFWSLAPQPDLWPLTNGQIMFLHHQVETLQGRGAVGRDGLLLGLMAALGNKGAPSADLPRWLRDVLDQASGLDVLRGGVSALSARAGRSHAHLCRALRQHLDTTPSRLITELRVARAKQLLSTSERKIDDIAEDCGFTHRSHLTRHFKAATGQSPHAWRQAHKSNPVTDP